MTEKITLADKILSETATITWSELQTLYAKGVLIWVSASLDLIEVATDFAEDNSDKVKYWLTSAKVQKMSDDKARQWHKTQPELWASVVAPWVLVQDKSKTQIEKSPIERLQ